MGPGVQRAGLLLRLCPGAAPHPRPTRAWRAVVVLGALACAGARADENGASVWLPGSFASLAAVPVEPGFYVLAMPYVYGGSHTGSKGLPRGGSVSAELDAQVAILATLVGYAPEARVLGGQLMAGLAFAGGFVSAQQRGAVPIGSTVAVRDVADSKTGGSDLYPIATLYWSDDVHSWMTYVLGDLPVGAYDPQRIANIGLGHFAVDVGGGYTYLNPRIGLQASAVVGFTFNFENTHTDYTNGIDSHLDWSVSQFLSEAFFVGPAGYVYWQLTSDTYPTAGIAGAARSAILGTFQSGVASLGGEVGAVVKVGGLQGLLSLRGYWEFWAQNRLQGYSIFAQLNVPIFR